MRTDMWKLIVAFRSFANAPKTAYFILLFLLFLLLLLLLLTFYFADGCNLYFYNWVVFNAS
jgi:hypothetical protein